MKTYIYGEVYLKTRKNLYLLKSFNIGDNGKKTTDFYIAVKGFSCQNGKTNVFTFGDGNKHITCFENGENPLFNGIKKGSRLYNAIQKRIN
jgi:hypothetical protein